MKKIKSLKFEYFISLDKLFPSFLFSDNSLYTDYIIIKCISFLNKFVTNFTRNYNTNIFHQIPMFSEYAVVNFDCGFM